MTGRQRSGSGGLGELIRTRRIELGMTQHELALRIDSSDAYVSMIELGKKQWPRRFVPELSRILGMSEIEMAIAAGLISDPNATEAKAA